MRPSFAAIACTALVLLSSAPTAPAAGPAESVLEVLEYQAPVPAPWQSLPPASNFRAAQYRVPAAAGASDGEAIVYYFGQGQGGSAAANGARWAAQFSGDDGKPVEPRVETFTVGGMAATLIELNGSYARGIGMAQGVAARPGQTLLAAVVESPRGNLIFQLHGDRATVERHRSAFVAMVKGLRPR